MKISKKNLIENTDNFSVEKIKGTVKKCLSRLRASDQYLLDIEVNERTITHKLAEYLQEYFPRFKVDCEYNRYENYIKRIRNKEEKIKLVSELKDYELVDLIWENKRGNTIYPDIIVHRRGTQEYNLLVIEVKKSSNPDSGDDDIEKIKELMERPYSYRYGLFLKIDIHGESDELKWQRI